MSRTLNRRSFLTRIAKGGVVAGGALALVTGTASAIEPATDHDPTDAVGQSRTDNDPTDAHHSHEQVDGEG